LDREALQGCIEDSSPGAAGIGVQIDVCGAVVESKDLTVFDYTDG
jgi:hypothetical protein